MQYLPWVSSLVLNFSVLNKTYESITGIPLSMEEIAKLEEIYNFLLFEPLRISFQGKQSWFRKRLYETIFKSWKG